MKEISFFKIMIEKIVESNAKVGMVLELDNKKMKCEHITKHNGKDVYLFDNGRAFYKETIVKSILECHNDKKEWRVAS